MRPGKKQRKIKMVNIGNNLNEMTKQTRLTINN